ncbi:hypothetical protein N3K63_07810 [Microbacterium sp. W1N]|uniref:hypothetical protein n=1 Tax=Microbacterium festucae TaxID=2977531 RepID=UPI0021BE7C14|nr:hypothetical protein [Microbacterium festucae]MCT9820190.1 hypothetical protein [Microbacterium festucae]
MTAKSSLWQRLVRFFRPETETYETRQNRPSARADTPNDQFNEPTDQRRGHWAG